MLLQSLGDGQLYVFWQADARQAKQVYFGHEPMHLSTVLRAERLLCRHRQSVLRQNLELQEEYTDADLTVNHVEDVRHYHRPTCLL